MESAALEWTKSPLVKRAVALAGPGAETIDILETLVEVMNDVEDRFPGVTFTDLFTAQVDESNRSGRVAVGYSLLDRGFSKYEVDEMMGGRERWGLGRAEANRIRHGTHPAIAMYAVGMSMSEVAEALGISKSMVGKVVLAAKKNGTLDKVKAEKAALIRDAVQ